MKKHLLAYLLSTYLESLVNLYHFSLHHLNRILKGKSLDPQLSPIIKHDIGLAKQSLPQDFLIKKVPEPENIFSGLRPPITINHLWFMPLAVFISHKI